MTHVVLKDFPAKGNEGAARQELKNAKDSACKNWEEKLKKGQEMAFVLAMVSGLWDVAQRICGAWFLRVAFFEMLIPMTLRVGENFEPWQVALIMQVKSRA